MQSEVSEVSIPVEFWSGTVGHLQAQVERLVGPLLERRSGKDRRLRRAGVSREAGERSLLQPSGRAGARGPSSLLTRLGASETGGSGTLKHG